MEIEVKVPDIGLEEVEIIAILVQVGDYIVKDQEIVTVEGEKASIDIPSKYNGIVKKILVKIGDLVKKNSLMLIVDIKSINYVSENASKKNIDKLCVDNICKILPKKHHTVDYMPNNCFYDKKFVHASPLVRKMSRVMNINLSNIKGSGVNSRILKEDLNKHIRMLDESIECNNKNSSNILEKITELKNDLDKFGSIKKVRMSYIQRKVSKNLSSYWVQIPHVTHFDEVDVTNLESFRKKINNKQSTQTIIKKNINVTLLIFLIKIVTYALKKFPIFNSSLSENKQYIFLKQYYNIGVAVNTAKGLLVPVIKNVDKKNIYEISQELKKISEKSRTEMLKISDMEGGCFTISNLGKLGGTYFTPIINSPEVAILGISKVSQKLVWKNNEFVPRLMLPLSMSYDHRVINGMEAAHFITCISEYLSDIRLLSI
ncbi:dihydrolipoamide acetyltransferase [Buchnera aphidicola (Nipponaphis monzeni)]|uniref:Dihydrolipoamide acetyltransferase component of pyruvate dehydrogenase complex n=1 Tax=Buchnera aphidicola (Nipponaphis monzeni) TaxID=2495405 RepID=A0A455TA20_9GAMM|nr:2-oxo acid dehydrogenase subunit E2 [Buchnera aphidicola]BBI01181.1 dihydrolipoamide acetyltransferase [Buchnera aphidicola (Nipponaphis monzeni)]